MNYLAAFFPILYCFRGCEEINDDDSNVWL
jgi:hypothetical protein